MQHAILDTEYQIKFWP